MSEKKFGLIGKTLKHSYSKIIHEKFGGYDYNLYEITPENLKEFVLSKELAGYNVTIPYKKDIIPLLDYVDESAKKIGAVNTVVNKGGLLYGYNTDFLGMVYMLNRASITIKDKVVMILGSGGTSNTANAVAKSLGAKEILTVSRTGEINYQNCYDIKGVQVIINTTPVGMYPNTDQSPIDLIRFSNLEGVADVIYNPFITKLTYQAQQLKIKNTNGLPMLVAQAKYAKDLFFDNVADDSLIDQILNELNREMTNIVLIGMPGSGKSTLGKIIAEKLGREFIDTDEEIVKIDGRTIPEIFLADGEPFFRELENKVAKEVGGLYGKVISTGGGIIKNKENHFALKKNGRIYLVNRALEKLVTEGRPLSKDKETVEKMYRERKPLYEFFADEIIENDGEIDSAVKGVIEKYENTRD